MPFLTEEIWQHIENRTPDEALIVAKYPEMIPFDEKIIADFEFAADVISGIRKVRKDKNIAFKDAIELSLLDNEKKSSTFNSLIEKLGNTSEIQSVGEPVEGALSFRIKSNEYFIPVAGTIDVEAESSKLKEELKYTEGFLKSVQKKLSNERFVNNAPEQVIANERKKEADALAKIETLKASLKNL